MATKGRVQVALWIVTVAKPLRYTIDEMIDAVVAAYEPHGIDIAVAGREPLERPDYLDIDAGDCRRGFVTAEQSELFSIRHGNGVHAYFVRSTVPAYNGCAAHKRGSPSLLVVNQASRWTLAHELGHLFGLNHVARLDRLMTGGGTDRINADPARLADDEIRTIMQSPYVTPTAVGGP